MGNVLSSASTRAQLGKSSIGESEIMSDTSDSHENENDEVKNEVYLDANDENRLKSREKEMIEFKKDLTIKREQRRQILARHRAEKMELEKSLNNERNTRLELSETNKILIDLLTKNNIDIPDTLKSSDITSDLTKAIAEMREEFEVLKANNNRLRSDLANSNISLQNANSDIADLHAQNTESMKQISALKDVVAVSKTMVALREQQLNELKNKLGEIEKSLADREANMLSSDLRQEYERQLQNIRTLRGLYEERARLAEVTRQSLVRELEEQKLLHQAEVNKTKSLTEKVTQLEDKVDGLIETIQNKNNQISVSQGESQGLRAEMSVVNKLFSEVLLSNKTKNDLDKLVVRLEENHGILTQMAERENDSEASTELPKLLLEIVNQVEEDKDNKNVENLQENELPENSSIEEISVKDSVTTTTPEEIVQNLPKVWRVLMELLSHQNVTEPDSSDKVTTCYKSVETKSGCVLVPSVSQTYIRLKDLIIEKLTLIKEVNRMKQLNTHLETRLGEQERRLCLVTTELSKTWHVVGRLRRHHHQLHTHEKILKYELQQKRKLLNELKEELEYCREKWEQAREKNTQSEKDWRKLRAEFANRKIKAESPIFNHSAESGYSDERPSDDSSESNDESEHITETQVKYKKKFKKSFETILDSSTDFNPFAEREDPASDMLDVAELPLDAHDDSHSDNLQKSEVLCEETEDEVCDITVDSYVEDGSLNHIPSSADINETKMENLFISPQNGSETNNEVKNENDLNLSKPDKNKLSVIDEDEPSCSREIQKINEENFSECNVVTMTCEVENHVKSSSNDDKKVNECLDKNQTLDNKNTDEVPLVDFKSILENVRKQDEKLLHKDKRLDALELSCKAVVKSMQSTLQTGKDIDSKLDTLQMKISHSPQSNTNADSTEIKHSLVTRSDEPEPEPSTSHDVDHEARFAARDIRLKRLEEQTKCLVNKVNKTNSKGVKIHYKLEELHNIYGSENSRAGTPSDVDEDKSEENSSDN